MRASERGLAVQRPAFPAPSRCRGHRRKTRADHAAGMRRCAREVVWHANGKTSSVSSGRAGAIRDPSPQDPICAKIACHWGLSTDSMVWVAAFAGTTSTTRSLPTSPPGEGWEKLPLIHRHQPTFLAGGPALSLLQWQLRGCVARQEPTYPRGLIDPL